MLLPLPPGFIHSMNHQTKPNKSLSQSVASLSKMSILVWFSLCERSIVFECRQMGTIIHEQWKFIQWWKYTVMQFTPCFAPWWMASTAFLNAFTLPLTSWHFILKADFTHSENIRCESKFSTLCIFLLVQNIITPVRHLL